MRISKHPVLKDKDNKEVQFWFSGEEYLGMKGESVAAALLANNIRILSYSEKRQEPRGLFCGIGHCYECSIYIKGIGDVRACITPIEEGMEIYFKGGNKI